MITHRIGNVVVSPTCFSHNEGSAKGEGGLKRFYPVLVGEGVAGVQSQTSDFLFLSLSIDRGSR